MRYGQHPYFFTPAEEHREAWREEIAKLAEEMKEAIRKPAGRVVAGHTQQEVTP